MPVGEIVQLVAIIPDIVELPIVFAEFGNGFPVAGTNGAIHLMLEE